ncbi:MAG: GntR family transcriptional regulator [Bacillota bacterium]|nr:MAG: GntR family transcriptional regulator [Bacillota bacterium]
MRMPLNPNSTQPLYRQIHGYLRQSILSQSLPPNTRLPATRQLAKDLGVSRITVENAYADLVADGLASTQVGSGTFVLPPYTINNPKASHEPWPLWQHEFACVPLELCEQVSSSCHPRQISFAEGSADPSLFPIDEFRRTMASVMRQAPHASLDYGEPRGFLGLRTNIAHILSSQGIMIPPTNVLITVGSQQAITLVIQVLLKPGDVILVESPTYGKALELFSAFHLKVVSIPIDKDGMKTELLEGILQAYHPKLIYTIPNFQNPSGASLSGRRRRELVSLASRYNVPILEDDFVGDLRYDGCAQPALKSLDTSGGVIYVGTFSKMLMPGLRIGFVVAEGPIYGALVKRKYVQDLATPNLVQHALDAYVSIGRYQTHLRRSCRVYRKRRDAMAQAIGRYLPQVDVDIPQGGLFMWLRLPQELTATELLPLAWKEGIDFALGENYCADGSGSNYLRLNFAALSVEEIEEGIRRLGVTLAKLQKLS